VGTAGILLQAIINLKFSEGWVCNNHLIFVLMDAYSQGSHRGKASSHEPKKPAGKPVKPADSLRLENFRHILGWEPDRFMYRAGSCIGPDRFHREPAEPALLTVQKPRLLILAVP
jgi:hypothetical protein